MPPIKISIAIIFYSPCPLKELGEGGGGGKKKCCLKYFLKYFLKFKKKLKNFFFFDF